MLRDQDGLTVELIESMKPRQIQELGADDVASLTKELQDALTPEQFTRITSEKLEEWPNEEVWSGMTPRFIGKISIEKLMQTIDHLPEINIMEEEEFEDQDQEEKDRINNVRKLFAKLSKEHINAIQDNLSEGHLSLLNEA